MRTNQHEGREVEAPIDIMHGAEVKANEVYENWKVCELINFEQANEVLGGGAVADDASRK